MFFSLLKMIVPSVHFLVKQCHNQWRSSLFRTFVIINQRQLATKAQQKKNSDSKNDTLVQSTTDSQIEVATFKEKGKRKKHFYKNIFFLSHSSTSSKRYRLFTCCYCWCCCTRWLMLFNVTGTLFERNTEWNL